MIIRLAISRDTHGDRADLRAGRRTSASDSPSDSRAGLVRTRTSVSHNGENPSEFAMKSLSLSLCMWDIPHNGEDRVILADNRASRGAPPIKPRLSRGRREDHDLGPRDLTGDPLRHDVSVKCVERARMRRCLAARKCFSCDTSEEIRRD